MSVTYVIEFRLRPGVRDRFRDLLDGVLDAMRHEATFEAAVLHQDPADADRFLLYETWSDHRDVVEVQLGRPYRSAWHAALPELLQGERGISVWTPLRSDRRR